MAIDPSILTRFRGADVGGAIGRGLANAQRIQQIGQEREQAPFRNQLLEQQAETGRQAQFTARDDRRTASITKDALQLQGPLARAVESGDTSEVEAFLQNNIASLQSRAAAGEDVDATESMEALQQLRIEGPQALLNTANDVIGLATRLGQLSSTGSAVQSSSFIPGVGFATLSKSGEAGLVPVEGVGETAGQKRERDTQKSIRVEQQRALLQGKSAAVKQAVTKGGQAFDKIQPLSTTISNYDEAIAALDSGAETGVIASMLPSFRDASITLDNVVKRLGLDVVGATTFGALSESELKFALEAAIPDNLQPAELKQWLIAKRDSQKKVKARVEQAASFLSDGEHTLKDWIAFDAAQQLNQKNQIDAGAQQPSQQSQPVTAGRFQIEVVQ